MARCSDIEGKGIEQCIKGNTYWIWRTEPTPSSYWSKIIVADKGNTVAEYPLFIFIRFVDKLPIAVVANRLLI